MSDMSRPGPLPPAAPDHERHDQLLVAQFVAGDPLKPEQQAEAKRLVGSCGACAALAADLPAISRAVAAEPVPPRRRDFRLSPEQAEAVAGNAVTRFLRRLSLPSSRAFQPAAAGVLSIGLLLVVAGYAWPEDGTVTVQAEPNLVDWTTAAPSAPAGAVLDDAPAAGAPADEAEIGAALEGAEVTMDDAEFADSLAESQAGLSEGRAQKSAADRDEAPPAPESDVRASEAQALEAPKLEVAEEAAGFEGSEETDRVAPDDDAAVRGGAQLREQAEVSSGAVTLETADPEAIVADDVLTLMTEDDPAPTTEDGPIEPLILLGLLLALGGGGLLLLGWLARRARDPLAP